MTETLEPGKSIKPNVNSELAKKLILEHFGYQVSKIEELNSYDDNNFYTEVILEKLRLFLNAVTH